MTIAKIPDIKVPVDFPLDKENEEKVQRISVIALDKKIGKKIPILNKGFIRLIDYMGDDSSITQSARVSYGQGKKSSSQDAGLIDFLIRHKHTSPLEMCEIKFHVKMPIFVARQWLRHRTASINELSARYSVITDDFFIPDSCDVRKQSLQNKQGRENKLAEEDTKEILGKVETVCNDSFDVYKNLIDKGLTREISRSILPQGTYTEFYWKIDLHNLLHFIKLRIHTSAQKEIRAYAEVILENFVKHWVPMVYKSFVNHIIKGEAFSQNQMLELIKLLDEKKVEKFINKKVDAVGEERELINTLKTLLPISKN
ncbi:MAG: FAD-dependent thymidylate synthase [Alphaproteobacteria bacterium]|nr:FAD-dependent thymidylate synthase [Rickettsiales bacterium]